MEYLLARSGTIIDDNTSTVSKTQGLVLGNLTRCHHEASQNFVVLGCGLAETSQSVTIFGNDQNVCRSRGVDVFEGHDFVVFFDHRCGNLFGKNLVKKSSGFGVSFSCQPDAVPSAIVVPFRQTATDLCFDEK